MNRVKTFFPGGNTCFGFYSFYSQIIFNPIKKFIIKGGPGTGKSTFIYSIGQEMLKNNLGIELHKCSSDNHSYDGLVVPSIRAAVIDGTAPHVVDPENPGIIEEILDFGQFWDTGILLQNKEEIINKNILYKRMFKSAYYALKEAKVSHDEWKSYIIESTIDRKVNSLSQSLIKKLSLDSQCNNQQKTRHIFAGAITPEGLVNEYNSILYDCEEIIKINGSPGSGKSFMLQCLLNTLEGNGYNLEVFHCPFNPNNLEGLLIKDLKIGIVASSELDERREFPNKTILQNIDLNEYCQLNKDLVNEINSAEENFKNSVQRGITFINKAKKIHDELEYYYSNSMNFDDLGELKDKIIKQFLDLK